jgi:hypothetical protein
MEHHRHRNETAYGNRRQRTTGKACQGASKATVPEPTPHIQQLNKNRRRSIDRDPARGQSSQRVAHRVVGYHRHGDIPTTSDSWHHQSRCPPARRRLCGAVAIRPALETEDGGERSGNRTKGPGERRRQFCRKRESTTGSNIMICRYEFPQHHEHRTSGGFQTGQGPAPIGRKQSRSLPAQRCVFIKHVGVNHRRYCMGSDRCAQSCLRPGLTLRTERAGKTAFRMEGLW